MDTPIIKIRELKRKDRKILAGMIKKLVDKMGDNKLLNLIVTSDSEQVENPSRPKDQFSKIGVEVIKLLLEFLEDDVSIWFADLLNTTVDKLDDMPLDIELQVITQIVESPEANRFFTSASHLYSKTRGLAKKFSDQKKE